MNKQKTIRNVILSNSQSSIVQKNNNLLHCIKYDDMAGLFRKDLDITYAFGRKICDLVKKQFINEGFFTSDELPRYGITRKEKRQILLSCDASKNDLVVILAYSKDISFDIMDYLDKIFEQESQNMAYIYNKIRQ